MSLKYANHRITEKEYLKGELIAEIKHEFIDGEVYAMAEASEIHNLISGNIFTELKNQLKGTPFRTFIADMKVKVANDFFYPDVMVVCQPEIARDGVYAASQSGTGTAIARDGVNAGSQSGTGSANEVDYYKQSPVIIVEVLSKTTRRFEKTAKQLKYQDIPTLEEYVLIEQTIGEIEVFRKKDHWQSFYYYLGDTITFDSLGLSVLVEDIYYQVNNEDVLAFLQEKSNRS